MQEVIGSNPLSSTQPHQYFLMRFFSSRIVVFDTW